MARLSKQLTDTLPDNLDDRLVDHLKVGLESALQERFGDDQAAKIACLNRYGERIKNGDFAEKDPCRVAEGRVALSLVLVELNGNLEIQRLNKKET